ncbi:MAG: hypothetical protein H6884_09765 [Rhodobiaceae bacterium]|nr:hypothetical protein [Rhodobiaceae bacterium]MCC0054333.1 hypothetical protein [Rhodobiaceae bacterium]
MAKHPALSVRSTRERFRRAGLAFTRTPVEIAADSLSADALARITSEPNLVVTELGAPAPEPPASAEERIAQISEAIPGLGEGGRTKDGKPKIAALEKLLGWKPAAEDIEAATAPQN